jgi:hypothetical protein
VAVYLMEGNGSTTREYGEMIFLSCTICSTFSASGSSSKTRNAEYYREIFLALLSFVRAFLTGWLRINSKSPLPQVVKMMRNSLLQALPQVPPQRIATEAELATEPTEAVVLELDAVVMEEQAQPLPATGTTPTTDWTEAVVLDALVIVEEAEERQEPATVVEETEAEERQEHATVAEETEAEERQEPATVAEETEAEERQEPATVAEETEAEEMEAEEEGPHDYSLASISSADSVDTTGNHAILKDYVLSFAQPNQDGGGSGHSGESGSGR